MLAVMSQVAIGARLGDILVGSGRVSRRQLEEALLIQARSAERLGELLVRLGMVSEDELLTALAAQAGLPYLSDAALLAQDIPRPLVLRIPRRYAEKLGVLPLSLRERTLWVASSAPDTPARVDEVRFVAGVARVRFVLVTAGALQKAMAQAYALAL